MRLHSIGLAMALSTLTSYACPDLRGEYFANECPDSAQALPQLRLHQVECRAFGVQLLFKDAASQRAVGSVQWYVLGGEPLLAIESATGATSLQSGFDDDSINVIERYTPYQTGKQTVLRNRYDLDQDGNLVRSTMGPNGAGSSNFYVAKKNCPSAR